MLVPHFGVYQGRRASVRGWPVEPKQGFFLEFPSKLFILRKLRIYAKGAARGAALRVFFVRLEHRYETIDRAGGYGFACHG